MAPVASAQRPTASVAAGRRRLPRAERRAEILRAATGVFYAKGYEAASLQDIADAMGIKKASLFYYFASKEELLHATLAEIIGGGMANVRRILAVPGDPLTVLWRLVVGHIDHLCGNLVETAVFLHERKAIPPERRRAVLGDDYAYRALCIDLIRRGQAEALVRAELDPNLAALNILGSLNATYTWYRPGGDLSPALIGAHFAAMTINSLATPAALAAWRPPGPSPVALREARALGAPRR